jgi:hypothetical protein
MAAVGHRFVAVWKKGMRMNALMDLQPGWMAALPALLAGYRSERPAAVTAELFRMASCADAGLRAARILAELDACDAATGERGTLLARLHDALHDLEGVPLCSPLPVYDAPASDKLSMRRPEARIDDLVTTWA